MKQHQHAYAEPVQTNVVTYQTIEVWGDWNEVVEEWTYSCDCGDSIVTTRAINGPPRGRSGVGCICREYVLYERCPVHRVTYT